MPICLFLGLYALGVIHCFVWLDFSFDLSGAKIHFFLEHGAGKNGKKRRIQKDGF